MTPLPSRAGRPAPETAPAANARVIRFSVVDRTGQNSERCEATVVRRQLADGMTVHLGWKSRINQPAGGGWNNTLQLKAHGTQVAGHPLVLSTTSPENNVHWGIYRSDNVNGTQTHDLWRPRIATTMSEADPHA